MGGSAPAGPGASADCMIRFEVANGFDEHRIQVVLMVMRPMPLPPARRGNRAQ
jgi:hypothetical protein